MFVFEDPSIFFRSYLELCFGSDTPSHSALVEVLAEAQGLEAAPFA